MWELDFALLWWKQKTIEKSWERLARMVKQWLGSPASTGGVERLFSGAGRKHDALKKATEAGTLEDELMVAVNTEY